MVEQLTRFIGRRRWSLLAGWIVLLGVAATVSSPLPTLLSGGGWTVYGSDSAHVATALKDGERGNVFWVHDSAP